MLNIFPPGWWHNLAVMLCCVGDRSYQTIRRDCLTGLMGRITKTDPTGRLQLQHPPAVTEQHLEFSTLLRGGGAWWCRVGWHASHAEWVNVEQRKSNRKSKMKAILGSLYMYMIILCDIEGVRSEPKPPSIFVSVLIRHEVKIFLMWNFNFFNF